MIKKLTFLLLLFLSNFIFSQETSNGPEMADTWRQDGKIFVVIGVMSVIFCCVIVYLIVIERKLKKLEEELKERK